MFKESADLVKTEILFHAAGAAKCVKGGYLLFSVSSHP